MCGCGLTESIRSKRMTKEELLSEFNYGITVAQLIKRLENLPQDLIVVNDCRDNEPIADISVTGVDYCFDEIITKKVVSIF